MIVALVFAGGALGAPARYVLDRAMRRWLDGLFPYGTLTVNLVGSAILGALVGAASQAHVSHGVATFAGTGVCGALTTFSTFGYETVRLIEDGSAGKAALNAFGNLVPGVVVAAGAYAGAAALV